MISVASTIKIKYLPLVLILLLGALLRFYKIKDAFPFDHDQEQVANFAYNFFVNHKLSLIGQELSFPGFFLGPVHSLAGTVPYGICNLSPDCVPYLFITIGIITIVLLYLATKKILGTKVATAAALIYAVSFTAITAERAASSNFFLFLASLGLFFSLHKYFQKKEQFLPIGALVAGLATVNFNPVFIFSSAAFLATAALGKMKIDSFILSAGVLSSSLKIRFIHGLKAAVFSLGIKLLAISLVVFFLNYLPLAIFNVRHENILARSLGNFASQNAPDLTFLERFVYLTKSVVVPYYSYYLFQGASPLFIALTLVLISIGLYHIFKNRQKILLFAPIWISITILGFVFYSGPIPDYYFMQTLLPLTLIIAIAATRNVILLAVFLLFFLTANLTTATNYSTIINYQIKKQAIDYVTSDSQGTSFNVYYDLPMGMNTGYSYLFKAKGRIPQEGGELLYIIEFKDPRELDFKKYQQTFSDKFVQVKSFGYLHVVSVE